MLLLILSFSLTYLIKRYAIKKSLLAKVNERSLHVAPTPHGGGVAIALSWFVGLIYLYASSQIEPSLFYALMFGVIIAVVGFLDDMYELSPKIRVFTQAVVAIMGLFTLGGLDTISFGVFDISNVFLTNTFAFLMILWYINLTNFIDGIDGYVGTKFIFLSLAGYLLFGGGHFLVLFVATLGFLYFNWHKARIFMGDVGSTLLGYTIAIITIYYANQEASNLWIWITLFALFWFDATITLIRRKLSGEKLSQAHKKHAYQRLTQAGWSHAKVTLYAVGLNIAIFSLIYFIPNIAISFSLGLALLYGAMKFVDSKVEFV